MAQMLTVDEIKRAKKQYPGAPVVLYVNTLASCKAECDVCCTSANAVDVIKSLDADTILFGPDKNLAEYVSEKTGKKLIPLPANGFCPTHLLFQPEDVKVLKMQHPDAIAMAHPECSSEMRKAADFIGSTSKMCRYAKESHAKDFIVGTEEGILHRLRKENPQKNFYLAYEGAICPNMKLTTLDRLYAALKEEKNLVKVPEAVAKKARTSLETIIDLRIFTPLLEAKWSLRCLISEPFPLTAMTSRQSRSPRCICIVEEINSVCWCCSSVRSLSKPFVS
jgi:quinolinate synthase